MAQDMMNDDDKENSRPEKNIFFDGAIVLIDRSPCTRVSLWVESYCENGFGGCETLRQSGKTIWGMVDFEPDLDICRVPARILSQQPY